MIPASWLWAAFGLLLSFLGLVAGVGLLVRAVWGRVPRFLGADEFLYHLAEHRICYAGGRVGSGKTRTGVILSYLFQTLGMSDWTISNMPLSWSVPAWSAPGFKVFVLLDEAGAFLDARRFANKGQTDIVNNITGYMRKLEAYVYVASRLSPDARLRAVSLQRTISFQPFLLLDAYSWGLEDGENKAGGLFWIWGANWAWEVDRDNPTPKYADRAIPGGVRFINEWFTRAVRAVQLDEDRDANDFAPGQEEDERQFFDRIGLVYGLGPVRGADSSGAGQDRTVHDSPASVGEGGGTVYHGLVSESYRAGGRSFGM